MWNFEQTRNGLSQRGSLAQNAHRKVLSLIFKKVYFGIGSGIKCKSCNLCWSANPRIVALEPFCSTHYVTKILYENEHIFTRSVEKDFHWFFQRPNLP